LGSDSEVRTWDLTTSEELSSIHIPTPALALQVFDDGQRIITGHEDGTLRLWDSRTGQELLNIPAHSDAVSELCISPDGRRIASASGNPYTFRRDSSPMTVEVKIWDCGTPVYQPR
jgi:WD40 repeat protein